jgi:hypothetical protein
MHERADWRSALSRGRRLQAPGHSKLLRRHFLSPSEQVLLETHPSKWWYFPRVIVAAVFLAFFDYLVLARIDSGLPQVPLLSGWLASLPYPGYIAWSLLLESLAILLTVAWGLWAAWKFYRWVAQTYAVTDERIVQQTGIIRHIIQEIPIRQIRDTYVFQASFVARILRYGNLRFKSLSEIDSSTMVSKFDRLKYIYDPEHDLARESGVEWWVGVPNPFLIERTIEDATRATVRPGSPAAAAP